MNLCFNPIPSGNGEQTWIPWLILQVRKEESKLCQCPLAVDARLRGSPNAQCSPLPRKPGMEYMNLLLSTEVLTMATRRRIAQLGRIHSLMQGIAL